MNAPETLRLPPHSTEAEQSLIGGLLLDSSVWDKVSDVVTDADFYRDDHRRIYRHIQRLCESGNPADVVTVFASIEASNETDQTGGQGYLGDLANNVPSVANIRRHAKVVKELSSLRRLIGIGDNLASQCFNAGGRTAADLIAEVEQKLSVEVDTEANEPAQLSDVLADALVYINDRGETAGLQTGFQEFDRLTGGLEGGQLIIVAARPSVGKTLFAGNVSDMVAGQGKACLFFTLEMTKREIGMRILSARSAVSVHKMRSGTKEKPEWDKMYSISTESNGQRLWIDDKPAISVGYIRARARRMQRRHGLDLIVVDYIGLMKGTGDNRTQEIGSISRGLKSLAKELNVPIIALSQLNRGVEGRSDKRPMMSDLRDSGEIEQDADIVAMLHREELYNENQQWKGFAELIVRKNRNGPLGDVPLQYNGQLMTFGPWYGDSPRLRQEQTQKQPIKFRGMKD